MTRPSDAYTVGFPLNVCFWVVNAADYNRLVPVGAPGELLVEGPHLGRGYLNDTDKTAKAFVWDPDFVKLLGLSPGRRMYRTGDLVQQNADGSLIHLGRIDTQIKIRGQRVETGEIESTIVRIQRDVRMACVELVRLGEQDAASADPVLVAAIEVGDFGHDGEVNDSAPTVCPPTTALCAMIRNLRAEMLLALPRYMVPRFVPMTRLPLNASSKLDRRTTRSILAGLNRDQLAEFEKLPASVEDGRDLSPMERQLGRLLSQVLGCSPDDVGPDAHFVQLGGDSVTAMRLVAAAQGEGIRIGVADILQNPRLLDLARVAENYSAARSMDRDPAPFELWTGFADAETQEQQMWLERIAERCDVAAQEIEDVYPATPLQEGLMAVTAQQPGAYVAQHVFRIGRGVDIAHFRESWSKLIDAVAILRTRIVYHAATSDSMQVVVRRTLDWNEADSLEEYLASDKALPFSYGTPLNRLAIVRKSVDANDVNDEATSPYFVWTQHHSGYDGYQMALVLNMLAQIYQKGEAQPLPSLPPIPRFIKYLRQTDPKQSAAYWKQQLQDAHLTRFPRLPHPLYHPHADGLLERRVVQQQGSNSKTRNKSTPIAIVLRAAWAITMAAYTGSTEATSTVALAGRDIAVPDIGNMVVPTLATVPMRTRLDGRTMLVSDLLAAMTRQSDEMRPFLHTGMQHIRAAVPGLGLDFDPGHLFLVQPSMGDADNDPLQAIGLEEVHATDKADFGGYALAVQATVNPDRTVDVELRYDSKAFPEHMAEALFSQFEHIIQQLEADNSDKTTLGELELLAPIDVERLRKWNAPMLTAAPNRSCIHDLVQTVAERQPQVPAVKSWDGELSYAALSKASSRLAHYLVSIGVGPEVSVGVCMDKSMWATVSMLAILQAGGVVVALGTQYPLSRIGTVVADAGIRVTLADGAQAKRLQDLGKAPEDLVVAVVDRAFVEQLPAHDTSPPCTDVRPDNAAWVVYTSGSTGTPKGVVLEHQALCTGMIAHGTLFGIHTHTRALSYAAHTFSVVIEDFTTLILGGCICIPSENQRMNISELSSAICDMRVNFVNLTATAASLLDPSQLPDVKTVVLGGEAVTSAVVELWAKHATIINAYGQSECSVESVINNRIEHGKDATNIGLPIAGSAAWVVDPADYNRLVPVGAPGELLIQGPLLARGYLNDRAKTEACFVSDPAFLGQVGFSRPGRGRMYRTGDLVCQTEDGSLVYLGRSDAQIKIRGQRVEPGEIESRIVQVGHQHIAHAFVDLVTPRDASHDADPILTAAIELQTTEVEDVGHSPLDVRAPAPDLIEMIQRIRAALLQELPAYMIPSYFLPLTTRLPVNASGKLDRRAARAMLETLSREKLGAFSNRMAKNPNRVLSRTEEQLRTVYAEVLGCPADNIGPDDFFTELGGDSVAAMHVVGTSRRRGMIISVLDVLQRQSVSAVAEVVETRKNGGHDLHQDLNETSSAVTDIQEWMLNYHTARPEVGMTWFALDAPKPLADAEKMAEACRRLFAVVEALHTGFVQEADGKWRRVILPEYQHQVQIHNTAAGSVDKWTEDFIQRERSKPIESARPLADVAICTTTREHRILFRMSHAIYDGMCIHRFWSTLDDLYRTGQAKEMASFSQYVAHVENRRTTEASKYWAELLKGATMTPIGTPTARVHDKDNYIWRAGVIGPAKINLGKTLPKGTTCANVVKAAWTLVLARHAKRNDVVFVDLVSGRAGIDPSVTDALGCCSTPVPVRVQLDPLSTYADLVRAVQKQQLSSIPFETFGYGRITQDCTDWPSGTAASSWINHVPAPIKGSKLSIGGTEYTLSQPKQEEQNWTFSEARISWTHSADTDMLEFHLVYAVDKVSKQVAQDLYNGMVAVIDQILTAPQALIGSQLVRNL
jgi:amino acid adenylation domain-containing protein